MKKLILYLFLLTSFFITDSYASIQHTFAENGDLIRVHCTDTALDFHYSYDHKQNNVTVFDSSDNSVSKIQYTDQGPLITEILNESQSLNFRYSPSSLLISVENEKSQKSSFFEFLDYVSLERQLPEVTSNLLDSLFGRSFLVSLGFYIDPAEVGCYGKGEVNDKVRVSFINGILNDKMSQKETIQVISDFHNGLNIHYVFRPTEGYSRDVLKSMMVKSGWISPQAYDLAGLWKKLIAEMGGVNGGGTIIHIAHSIGSSDTDSAKYLMSKEELSMIKVYTLGSPTIIEPGYFKEIINYISKGDSICYLDPKRYMDAISNPQSHVQFLESSWGIPLVDHLLAFPAYKGILKALGEDFINTYGSL